MTRAGRCSGIVAFEENPTHRRAKLVRLTDVIDKAGYVLLFPGEPLELGRTLEMNDHRVTIA